MNHFKAIQWKLGFAALAAGVLVATQVGSAAAAIQLGSYVTKTATVTVANANNGVAVSQWRLGGDRSSICVPSQCGFPRQSFGADTPTTTAGATPWRRLRRVIDMQCAQLMSWRSPVESLGATGSMILTLTRGTRLRARRSLPTVPGGTRQHAIARLVTLATRPSLGGCYVSAQFRARLNPQARRARRARR